MKLKALHIRFKSTFRINMIYKLHRFGYAWCIRAGFREWNLQLESAFQDIRNWIDTEIEISKELFRWEQSNLNRFELTDLTHHIFISKYYRYYELISLLFNSGSMWYNKHKRQTIFTYIKIAGERTDN